MEANADSPAAFNRRAIRVYEQAGLRIEHTLDHRGRHWVQLVAP